MAQRTLFFDPQDHQLLTLINQTVTRMHSGPGSRMPYLRPNGIIELAAPVELRMASAVLRLLDTLAQGQTQDRLDALQALYDEVLVMARTSLRINTGRVLVQLMKELVRAHGDLETQLRLAHDFHKAATGDPATVRRLLHRCFMLEMPEAWNQAVFDNHVHDANTKGRKNATHLIMDAWLKGIRTLTVIYYNYVSLEAARELLYAASIVGITVRIGLLFHAPHRGRLVDLIWVPRGFASNEEFLNFLASPSVSGLMNEGRAATKWLEKRILHLLKTWNETERFTLAPMLHATPDPLDTQEFLKFVGSGQASTLHLAEYIHDRLFPLLKARAADVRTALEAEGLSGESRSALLTELNTLNSFTTETILARLADPERFPEFSHLQSACDDEGCPDILQQKPLALLSRLCGLRSGCRITLNLAGLTAEDVLILLWDCQGRITHLELFNLKDWHNGDLEDIQRINALQRAINDGSVPRIKQLIFSMLRSADAPADAKTQSGEDSLPMKLPENLSPAAKDFSPRAAKLRIILQNIPVLCDFYLNAKLGSTAGTDSTSRPGHRYGMGLAYPESLPRRARRELDNTSHSAHLRLPLRIELLEQTTFRSPMPEEGTSPFASLLRRLPGLGHYGFQRKREWLAVSEHSVVCDRGKCSIASSETPRNKGNIITLGGSDSAVTNGFCPAPPRRESLREKARFLNSRLSNALRILAGFVPAFLAFLCTQSGWLAWGGALLWFFISGLRNILQSVLGNGGLHRSSLLHWNSYVSWSGFSASLMYNGLSAVLLEPVLRRQILELSLGLDVVTAPVTTCTVLCLACGAFKALTHYLGGQSAKTLLADAAATLISIPLTLAFLVLLRAASTWAGADPTGLAAASVFVVKLASDAAIGFLNGMEDRRNNLRRRMADYRACLRTSLDLYSRLEVMFPEQSVVKLLEHPGTLLKTLKERSPVLGNAMILNALDLMYFWFYQPRAEDALAARLRRFSAGERQVLLGMQQVLRQERAVSQMFVDGLLGREFAAPLSFYLAHSEEYLRHMAELCAGKKRRA